MKNILCFGDSNTWGIDPRAFLEGRPDIRHARAVRWPGRLQIELGADYHVIEEGLSGRTTVFPDPTSPGRCGIDLLAPLLESHSPLGLVILMLGTNDCKPMFGVSEREIAMGMARLVRTALDPFLYAPWGRPPKVLIAAPVPFGELAPGDFCEGEEIRAKSAALAGAYAALAEMTGCAFLDLAPYGETLPGEGVHLTAESHLRIAAAYAEKVREILE